MKSLAVLLALSAAIAYAQGVNKSMQSTQVGKLQYALVLSPVKGVVLTEPTPGDLAKNGIPDAASREALAPVLPFAVLVKNSGTRAIVAFAIRFDIFDNYGSQDSGIISSIKDVDRIPQKRGTWVQYRDYRTLDSKIAAGASRLVTFDPLFTDAAASGHTATLASDPAYAAHVAQLKSLMNATLAVASLDGVLFDDGEFAGPDASGSFATLTLRGEHDLGMAKQLHTLDGQPDVAVLTMLAKYASEPRKVGDPSLVGVKVSGQAAYANYLGQTLETDGRAKYEASLKAMTEALSGAGVPWKGKKK